MKLAVQIVYLAMATLSGIGFLGTSKTEDKPHNLAGAVIFGAAVVAVQIAWR